MISVAIPVGPAPSHQKYLDEAIQSVRNQTVACNIILIDDMAGLDFSGTHTFISDEGIYHVDDLDHRFGGCRIWRSPWRLGVAHAFNFGVALAPDDEVLLLGADDTLEPDAVAAYLECSSWDAPEVRDRTYYSLPVRYMDTGEVQFDPCGAAVVSKQLWRLTGGFPTQSASGASDAAFLSSIWNSNEFMIKSVAQRPLYNYRRWEGTDTAGLGSWQGVILATRGLLTPLQKPNWGRYA